MCVHPMGMIVEKHSLVVIAFISSMNFDCMKNKRKTLRYLAPPGLRNPLLLHTREYITYTRWHDAYSGASVVGIVADIAACY